MKDISDICAKKVKLDGDGIKKKWLKAVVTAEEELIKHVKGQAVFQSIVGVKNALALTEKSYQEMKSKWESLDNTDHPIDASATPKKAKKAKKDRQE